MNARANLSIAPNDNVHFKVRHEDDDLAVVDKPTGLVTQPGLGHEKDTLLNGLFARWGNKLQNLGADRDFGLLHRLDRAASGLLIVGLRPNAYDALRAQFEQRQIRKFYWAVVKGTPKQPSGVINLPIAEVGFGGGLGGSEKKVARIARSGPNAKPATTAYRVLESSNVASLVECRPLTGRLHQIRVHMDAIGCPILGDDIYGPAAMRSASRRLALHAHRLAFTHPITGAQVDVRSVWPKDLNGVLKRTHLHKPGDAPRPTDAADPDTAGDAD